MSAGHGRNGHPVRAGREGNVVTVTYVEASHRAPGEMGKQEREQDGRLGGMELNMSHRSTKKATDRA